MNQNKAELFEPKSYNGKLYGCCDDDDDDDDDDGDDHGYDYDERFSLKEAMTAKIRLQSALVDDRR